MGNQLQKPTLGRETSGDSSSSEGADPLADLSEIEPGRLFLSCDVPARYPALLRDRGFTAVVTVMATRIGDNGSVAGLVAGVTDAGLLSMHIAVDDMRTERLVDHFEAVSAFISAAPDGKVLVHCSAGRSRSASCIVAHVMLARNMNARDAFAAVRAVRPCVAPNTGFVAQLVEFEARLGRPASVDFLGEYVLQEMMGGAETTRKYGITARALQAAIDECDGNVAEAQLKLMKGARDAARTDTHHSE